MKAFFTREFDYQKPDGRWGRVVDCAVVGFSAAYLAYETGDGEGKNEVGAIICLLTRPKGQQNFGYKDMSETTHPFYYDCPERILKRLTPTNNQHARAWRRKCRDRIDTRRSRPKLAEGMVIKFAKPVSFTHGIYEDTFRVISPRGLVTTGLHCRRRLKLARGLLDEREWAVVSST